MDTVQEEKEIKKLVLKNGYWKKGMFQENTDIGRTEIPSKKLILKNCSMVEMILWRQENSFLKKLQ